MWDTASNEHSCKELAESHLTASRKLSPVGLMPTEFSSVGLGRFFLSVSALNIKAYRQSDKLFHCVVQASLSFQFPLGRDLEQTPGTALDFLRLYGTL